MLTRTSILAAQALAFMARQGPATVFSPRGLGQALGQSPSYLAKVLHHLVKVGILRSARGSRGGVQFARSAEEISLLAVVEACQGELRADHCQPGEACRDVCAFHETADELHRAIISVLAERSVRQLAMSPGRHARASECPPCLMSPRPPAALAAPAGKAGRRLSRSKR